MDQQQTELDVLIDQAYELFLELAADNLDEATLVSLLPSQPRVHSRLRLGRRDTSRSQTGRVAGSPSWVTEYRARI